MKRKKVLFISHWYPSIERPKNGVFVKKHAECIAEISDLTVVSFEIVYDHSIFRKTISWEESDGMTNCKIQIKSRFHKILYYTIPLQKYWLKRTFKKEGKSIASFDLIHTNFLFPSGIVGCYFAKKYKKPLLHTEHWSKINQFLKKDIYKKKGLETLKYATKITAVSSFLGQQIAKYVSSEKISIVPNLVDSSIFEFHEKNKNKKSLRLLCAAIWNKPKNPFYFLDALQEIYEQNLLAEFELNFVGDGLLLDDISRKKYSFPIHFHGFVASNEMPAFFHQADLFIHGSDNETFSIVLVEALSTGTPVLISRVGLAQELIHQGNGFICENNTEDWKNKILQASEIDYNHKQIAEQIGGKYDKKTISNLFLSIYDKI